MKPSPAAGPPENGKPRYHAMLSKNFKTAVFHLIATQYGSLGGGRKLAELLARDVDTLASQFFVSREFVRPGQMVLNAIDKSDRPRVGKTIRETKLKPVIVTLFSEEELKRWVKGEKNTELKKQRLARILKEAFEEGGVLQFGDLALIQLCGDRTAASYVHAYEQEHETVPPYRGTIHDLGQTTTHKRWIVGKYLEGKPYSTIKAETRHSTASISRYVKGYRRVVLLSKHFNQADISFITGMSKRLIKQYLKIGKEHNWKVL